MKEKFDTYPSNVLPLLIQLRSLIITVAEESETILTLEETIKWNEPSYITKHGSTLRFDWKAKQPDQYALYFKCTSKLVPIIKQLYGNTFKYETSRAIIFKLTDKIPKKEVKHCISLALGYHLIKHEYEV